MRDEDDEGDVILDDATEAGSEPAASAAGARAAASAASLGPVESSQPRPGDLLIGTETVTVQGATKHAGKQFWCTADGVASHGMDKNFATLRLRGKAVPSNVVMCRCCFQVFTVPGVTRMLAHVTQGKEFSGLSECTKMRKKTLEIKEEIGRSKMTAKQNADKQQVCTCVCALLALCASDTSE